MNWAFVPLSEWTRHHKIFLHHSRILMTSFCSPQVFYYGLTTIGGFMWRHMKPILQIMALATVILVFTPHSFVSETKENVQELFYSDYYHNTKLQRSDRNDNTQTWVKFEILLWSKWERQEIENLNLIFAVVKMYSN